ncbi:hypothetical protein ACQ856_18120 [Mycolicibacterium psychrotolerans]|uniref:hypothetical protein n=1 Tax=Mycolicibacterium psychrotolerans TaxID=216929 RepID=UPI003D67EA8E
MTAQLHPPGYTMRFCPVCRQKCGSTREPVADVRREIVVYQPHNDGIGKPCGMGGQVAAIGTVAFSNTRRRAS